MGEGEGEGMGRVPEGVSVGEKEEKCQLSITPRIAS